MKLIKKFSNFVKPFVILFNGLPDLQSIWNNLLFQIWVYFTLNRVGEKSQSTTVVNRKVIKDWQVYYEVWKEWY